MRIYLSLLLSLAMLPPLWSKDSNPFGELEKNIKVDLGAIKSQLEEKSGNYVFYRITDKGKKYEDQWAKKPSGSLADANTKLKKLDGEGKTCIFYFTYFYVEASWQPEEFKKRLDGLKNTISKDPQYKELNKSTSIFWIIKLDYRTEKAKKIKELSFIDFQLKSDLDITCGNEIKKSILASIQTKKSSFLGKPDETLKMYTDMLVEKMGKCEKKKTKVTILYGANANSSSLSSKSLNILEKLCENTDNPSPRISRTASSPSEQARIMYNLLEDEEEGGKEYCRKMYGSAGDKVIDVWVKYKKADSTAAEIREQMTAKINELGPENVSKHCGDFKIRNTFDVGPNSINNQTAFEDSTDSYVTKKVIEKFLNQDDYDPAYHIQILQ